MTELEEGRGGTVGKIRRKPGGGYRALPAVGTFARAGRASARRRRDAMRRDVGDTPPGAAPGSAYTDRRASSSRIASAR